MAIAPRVVQVVSREKLAHTDERAICFAKRPGMMSVMSRWAAVTGILLPLCGAACDAVVIRPPAPDDGSLAGADVGPPSTGGAPGAGGSTNIGGASMAGGEASMGGGPDVGGSPNTGGGSCVADPTLPSGAPVVIASGLNRPVGMAIVGQHVYVTQTGDGGADGALVRLPKLGGPLEHVVSDQNQPWAVTADAQYVYWVNHGDGDNGSLSRLALAGGAVEVLAEKLRYPWGIAAHQGSLFATELNNNRVIVVRPDGSLEVVTNSFTGLPIAVDAGGVYVGVMGLGAWGESISRIDSQGNPSILYEQPAPSEILLLDGDDLYFSEQGALRRGKRDGSGVTTIAGVSMVGSITAVIADCFVYFAVQEDTYVGRVSLDNGELQVVAANEALPAAIAVDDDAIYWVNQASGTVMRLAKSTE
jgi:hypothetical protein